jgi:hypothetical protein
MATTSQKMMLAVCQPVRCAPPACMAHLMRFFVRMRGARTPPPRMDAPVTKMPLRAASAGPRAAVETSAPGGARDAEPEVEADARRGPRVRRRLLEEAPDVERLARACAARRQPPRRLRSTCGAPVRRI